jgi:hypothetical protein
MQKKVLFKKAHTTYKKIGRMGLFLIANEADA